MSGQSSTGFGGIRYRVVANDAQLRQVMERDQSYMDRAAREVRDARSEWRRQHEEMKVELVEEERRWENECERLRKEGAQMVKSECRQEGISWYAKHVIDSVVRHGISSRQRKARDTGVHIGSEQSRESEARARGKCGRAADRHRRMYG